MITKINSKLLQAVVLSVPFLMLYIVYFNKPELGLVGSFSNSLNGIETWFTILFIVGLVIPLFIKPFYDYSFLNYYLSFSKRYFRSLFNNILFFFMVIVIGVILLSPFIDFSNMQVDELNNIAGIFFLSLIIVFISKYAIKKYCNVTYSTSFGELRDINNNTHFISNYLEQMSKDTSLLREIMAEYVELKKNNQSNRDRKDNEK